MQYFADKHYRGNTLKTFNPRNTIKNIKHIKSMANLKEIIAKIK